MTEELRFIASYNDIIDFCETDIVMANRFRNTFAEAQAREVTFNPVLSAASNPELLTKKHDFWTKQNDPSKRGIGTFDENKYTRFFITHMKKHLKKPEKYDAIARTGFDPYGHLMEFEEEINSFYHDSTYSKLDLAALHFVETGKEAPEVDYLKYVASYDDVTEALKDEAVDSIYELGKTHYNTIGLPELLKGTREVTEFFDSDKYIASYAHVADNFKNEDGTLDEHSATIAYITWGASNGLSRNLFMPYVYVANYIDLIKEDIFINGEISFKKVAKIWLNKFKDGILLDKFDAHDFKETMELGEEEDPYKVFVLKKITEYKKQLARENSCFYKLGKLLCASKPKVKETPEETTEETPEETTEETPEETPTETPEETPTEIPEETPTETPEETPTETPEETPPVPPPPKPRRRGLFKKKRKQ